MSDVKKKIEEILGPVLDENKDLEGRLNAALAKISYLDEALSKQGQLKAENYNKYLNARNNLEYYRERTIDQVEKIDEFEVVISKQRDEISELKMKAARATKAVETKEKLIRDYADMQLALEGKVRYLQSKVRRMAAKDENKIIKSNILLALDSCLEAGEGKPVGMRALLKANGYLLNQSVKNLDKAVKELDEEGLICTHNYWDDRYTTFSMANTKNNLEKDIDLLVDVISQGNGPSVSWAWITEQQPTISKWDWEYAEKVIKAAEERNLVKVVCRSVLGAYFSLAE